jgi:Zn-dependent M28 family amino/carboxypeptidase
MANGVQFDMVTHRISAILLLVLLTAPPASAQRGGAAVIDSAGIWHALSALAADSMEGRRIGSAGNAKTRALIVARLRASAVLPVEGEYEHPFSVTLRDTSVHRGVNVLGVVRGADTSRVLVVSAHYDHVGTSGGVVYNGADDNASGTAALLALADWYARHPPRHTMVFAFFDGEETGLLGARAFVASPPVPLARIAANVNLDMIARLDKNELYAAGASPWPFFRPLLEATAHVAPIKLLLGHDTNATGAHDNWTDQSDHYAFHLAGIPWVCFGVEDHPDYHRPTDDVERINPGRYVGAMRTVADFLHRLDESLDAVVPARTSR